MLRRFGTFVCLVRTPSTRGAASELKVLPIREDVESETDLTDAVDVRYVDRHVHVPVIQGVKSLESFMSAFSNTLGKSEAQTH